MITPGKLADVLQVLRAAAEPTRLRLLAVCAQGEFTVGELCKVLGQSQPRVSRHLKLLCEAGLLVRFREGPWMYYRTPTEGRDAEAVSQLLAWLDPHDSTLERDAGRSAQIRKQRAAAAARDLAREAGYAAELLPSSDTMSDVLRQALLDELTVGANATDLGDLLDIGTGGGRVLKWLAPQARRAVGIDISRDVLRIARTVVHGAGLGHCGLQHGDMYALAFPDHSFDLITMDRVLSGADRPRAALREATRVLRPGGRLVVVEDYEQLEEAAGEGARNALAGLRAWLQAVGLNCERLRPVETGTRTFILAVGRQPGRLHEAA